MGDVVPFKKRSSAERAKDKTLCQSGFHRWEVVKEKQFDVRQGRLVTIYRCRRCGRQKTEAH